MGDQKKVKPMFNEEMKFLSKFHRQEHLDAQNNPLPKLNKTSEQVYKELIAFRKEARKVRFKEAIEKLERSKRKRGLETLSESQLNDLYKHMEERWEKEDV